MLGKRVAAEAYILKYIDLIDSSGKNVELYKIKFKAMSDDDFDRMIQGIEDGSVNLCIIAPNFSEVKLSVENNLRIGKELNYKFFQHVRIPARDGLPAYTTPIPYLILDLPVRRQAQLLEKKISIPENNLSVDNLTGQPTGKSKGSKISYPEVQVLAAMGMEHSLTEFLKYRGGDEKGFIAMNTAISRTGGFSQKAIEPFASGVKATQVLQSYLAAMMIKSNLTG